MFMESTGFPLIVIPFSCGVSKSSMTMKHSLENENVWDFFFVRCTVTYTIWWYSLWFYQMFERKKPQQSLNSYFRGAVIIFSPHSTIAQWREKKGIKSLSLLLSESHHTLSAKSYTKIALTNGENPVCKAGPCFWLMEALPLLQEIIPLLEEIIPLLQEIIAVP